MKKEELIKFIEALKIYEINAFKIQYYSEEKGYGYNDDRHEENVNYGCDFNQLYLQKIDQLNNRIAELEKALYEEE